MSKSGNICYKFKIMVISVLDNPVPTLEDIKEAEHLAKELKGDSTKDTLDEIIRFQNENIAYFNEKSVFPDAIIFGFIFGLFLFILILMQIPSIEMIFIFLALSIVLPAISIIMVTVDRFRKNKKWNKFLSKEYVQSIKEVYRYVIYQDIPVKKILDWKLAICKDYARLTASLILNLFPNSKLYFIYKYHHVVAGIRFNNEIYVFDPHYDHPTPVLKLDDWLIEKKLDAEKFEEFEQSKHSNFTFRYYYT